MISEFLFYASGLGASIILAICIYFLSTTNAYPVIKRSKKEQIFKNVLTNEDVKFPNIRDSISQTIDLSVVIPAYNEEKRLPLMLDECIEYLSSTNIRYEIIIVSDGSTDNTVKLSHKYSKKFSTENIRVLELDPNRGKGGAVRLGVLSARGSLILFADADGATKFSDYSKLEAALKSHFRGDITNYEDYADKLGISIGSRAHLEKDAIASRSFFRTVLMYGFHFVVWLFAVRGIKDTQCGFKLFTKKSAISCFESLHVERWAFDAELLYIAQYLKIPIFEVPVNWTEIDGSKVTPVLSWIEMGLDLFIIWLRYTIGAWRIRAETDLN